MSWYLQVWKKFGSGDGRARRREYWWFTLIHTLIFMVLVLMDMGLGTIAVDEDFGLVSGLYWFAGLLPNLTVTVRRLHDIGKSGWWIFINLVPLVGPVVFLIYMIRDSERHGNQYGPNPKLESLEHLAEVF